MDFTNKKVVLTGATGKLGRKIAVAFAKEGADISIYYNRSRDEAAKLVEEIKKMGRRACAIKVDIRNLGEIKKAVKLAVKFLGGIDILINNAAVFYKTSLKSVKEEEWNEILDINLMAPFFFAKEASKYLKKAGFGKIINIADTYGFSPSAHFVPYGVSKSGIIAMTKGLAKELAPDILVNCVCPGVIENKVDKGIAAKLPPKADPPLANALSDSRASSVAANNAISATLLKRPVEINDVVNTILFLAKNDSMTGQAIYVDGGKHV